MKGLTRQSLQLAALTLALLAVAGCRSIGPSTVRRDRFQYSAAVADSWKEQLLLNIVKTRYGDAPTFLEVSSLVSGYSLEMGVTVNGEFYTVKPGSDTFIGGELSGKFTDRPTISYTPLTGEKFTRSLLAPMPLDALMFAIQGGTPADFFLGLTVQSFEGHQNQGVFGKQFEPGDDSFTRLLHLLRTLQQARAIEVEVTKQGERVEVWLRFYPPDHGNAGVAQSLTELKSLLGVPPALDRVRVSFGRVAPEPEVIAVRTRSLMQILSILGAGVQIPEEHVADGSAVASGPSPARRPLVVHSGGKKPAAAFVAVPYDDLWFWIDRKDLASKITLSTVTVLFSFLDTSGKQSLPVLTIPTN